MKRILTLLFLLITTLGGQAQTRIEISCNEGIDLMSIVWRLAGAREYNNCQNTGLNEKVDAHFGAYVTHPAVLMAKEYIKKGVGYDAVASYGSLLKINSEGLPEFDKELEYKFDNRWSKSRRKKILNALEDFCADTGFHEWYLSTEDIRLEAMGTYIKLGDAIDTEWYSKWFSHSDSPSFRIIACPLAGQNNYGLSVNKRKGGVVLCPVLGSPSLDILIHEFCHPYCNPLIDRIFNNIASSAEAYFKANGSILKQQAYNNARIMMYESLVRASVIEYIAVHYPQVNISLLIDEETDKGFMLVGRLVDILDEGWTEKDLITAVNSYPLESYLADKEAADKLKVQYTCNLVSGAKNIPAGEFVFTMTFDRPMSESASINMSELDFPEVTGIEWSEDHRKLSIHFILESGMEYGFLIKGNGFIAQDGTKSVDSEISFKTIK